MGKHKNNRGRSNRHAPVPRTTAAATTDGVSEGMTAAMSGAASIAGNESGDGSKDIRLLQMVELLVGV